jgi:putative FmdB family regulatory protein
MPIYEYQCKKCGEHFEKFIRGFAQQNDLICPRCGSDEVEKAVSLFGLSGSSQTGSSGGSCGPSNSL